MADIFVSYASGDRDTVSSIVAAIEHKGWSVFWDRGLLPGNQWDQTLAHELSQAKCVIVVWSKLSVQSRWVIEEAMSGKSRNILVPLTIDDAEPPFGFGLIQYESLEGWGGQSDGQPLLRVFAQIEAAVNGKDVLGSRIAEPSRKKTSKMASSNVFWIGGATLILFVVPLIGWGVLTVMSQRQGGQVSPAGPHVNVPRAQKIAQITALLDSLFVPLENALSYDKITWNEILDLRDKKGDVGSAKERERKILDNHQKISTLIKGNLHRFDGDKELSDEMEYYLRHVERYFEIRQSGDWQTFPGQDWKGKAGLPWHDKFIDIVKSRRRALCAELTGLEADVWGKCASR